MHHSNPLANIDVLAGDTFALGEKLYIVVSHDDYSGGRCKECDAHYTVCHTTPNCSDPIFIFKKTDKPEELYALLRLKGEIS